MPIAFLLLCFCFFLFSDFLGISSSVLTHPVGLLSGLRLWWLSALPRSLSLYSATGCLAIPAVGRPFRPFRFLLSLHLCLQLRLGIWLSVYLSLSPAALPLPVSSVFTVFVRHYLLPDRHHPISPLPMSLMANRIDLVRLVLAGFPAVSLVAVRRPRVVHPAASLALYVP